MRAPRLFTLLALFGCGHPSDPGQLPREVDAVIEARCRRCHTNPPENFAPMPLVTWRDTQRRSGGVPIYERIASRIQSEDFPMPPLEADENTAFTEAERTILLAWIAAGTPKLIVEPDAEP